jgi:hypothetical protein
MLWILIELLLFMRIMCLWWRSDIEMIIMKCWLKYDYEMLIEVRLWNADRNMIMKCWYEMMFELWNIMMYEMRIHYDDRVVKLIWGLWSENEIVNEYEYELC